LFTVYVILVLCIPFAMAQGPVKGRVTDASGQGIPGVAVMVQGTTMGTVSDFEGNYSIEVPDKAVLIFSFIGYNQVEEAVNGRNAVDVVMQEDTKSLEEVVVTAIGIKQQKKKLGYATQEVDTDVLSESRTMNLGNALSGQVAGLAVSNPTGMFQRSEERRVGKERRDRESTT